MAHTTISVDKNIFQRTAKRAKKQYLSVSAVARMLLDAYADGRINIMAIQANSTPELQEVPESQITPELRTEAEQVSQMKKSELTNI